MRAPRRSLLVAPFHPDLLDACCDRLTSSDEVLVVVPRILLGRHVRERARERGLQPPRTMSWTELALELSAAEPGANAKGRLVPEAAAWIVRGLRQQSHRARTVYDGVLSERGFRTELRRAFEDLARAGLASGASIERFLVQHANALPIPLRNVLELNLLYRRRFEATHDDTAALFGRAAAVARGGRGAGHLLHANAVVFYGRAELDAVELELVAALAADAELAVAFLAPPAPGDPSLLPARLGALGFESMGSRATRPVIALAGISAPSQESEGMEVARRILAAADAGIEFSDMAVVARTPVRLEPVARALARAGVPHARATGVAIATTRAGRGVLALMDLIESEARLEPALLFLEVAPLAPGALGLDAEAVPSAWERVAREARLGRAPGAWDTRLARYAEIAARRAERAQAAGEPAARARAAADAATSMRAMWKALRTELDGFPARARWPEFIAALRTAVERLFVENAEREQVVAALERLQTLDAFGEERIARAEFHAAVRAALAETRDAPDIAGVVLGTATALHGCDFRLVCIVGLEEGEWPAAPADDPVLPDAARAHLSALLPQAGAALAPRVFARARERRLGMDAAHAARERLVLSWTRLDPQTGAARSPSTLMHEMAAVHGHDAADATWIERVPLRRRAMPADLSILDIAEFDEIAAASLPPRAARAYVRALGGAAARGLVLDTLRGQRARFTVADGNLATPASRTALVARVASMAFSATLLRDYLTCPFRGFMKHLLRLESLEPEVDRVPSPLAIGRLAHRTLETFHRELARTGKTLGDLADDALRVLLDGAARAARDAALAQGDMGRGLPWDVQWTILREDLRHFLRRERARERASAAPTSWVVSAFEARFGPETHRVAGIDRPDGGTIALRGSMDRLDARHPGPGWRVVDYKTGREPKGEHAALASLQLAVYLHVATDGDPALLARSEAQFAYVTRRGKYSTATLPGTALTVDPNAFARLVDGVAGGMEAGAFHPQPGDKGVHCESCAYTAVCDARVVAQAAFKERAGQTAWLARLPRFEAIPEAGA